MKYKRFVPEKNGSKLFQFDSIIFYGFYFNFYLFMLQFFIERS